MTQKTREDHLSLDTRRKIFEIVSSYPGLHFREIVRRLDMSPSNTEYHLRYLVKNDILVVIEDGRMKRFYVRGKVGYDDKRLLSVLRKEIPRGLVLFMLLNPGSTMDDILRNFSLSRSQIYYYVKKLEESNILHVETKKDAGDGGLETYFISDEDRVASVIISFKPSFRDALIESFVETWTARKKGKKRKRKK